MSNASPIAEAREIADSVEGWLNSLPPHERDSGDRDFDRRTLASLRVMADAVESQEVDSLLESVKGIGDRLEFMTEGIIAVANRARMVGSTMIPIEAIDKLLAEYERKFIK